MKEHACSRSFMFAVFDIFAKTRVRVRSCSIFLKDRMFVFDIFLRNQCSCSFIPALRVESRIRALLAQLFSPLN